MKKKMLIFMPILLIATIVSFVACYEELGNGRTNDDFSMTYEEEVTAARELYESMRSVKTRNGDVDLTTETGMIVSMEPLWGKMFAYRRKNKKIRTVEAVMEGSKRTLFMLPEVREKYLQTKDPRYKQSMTRLIVETNMKTGEKQVFTMTIIPSLEYLEKTNFTPFYNTYLEKDKDFSGVILFHELDGYFANGWRYEDGKVTHTIEGTTLSKEEIDLLKTFTRATKEECGMVAYYALVEECRLLCYKNEFVDVCEEQECDTFWEYQYSRYECKTVESNPESGQYNPPTKTNYALPESLKKFFEKNGIGEDISKLDAFFTEIMEDCSYTQMGDYISEAEFKLNEVKYNSSILGNAAITFGGVLLFRDESCLSKETIEHELFHMYQCAYGSSFTYCAESENVTAREFERQLFSDIQLYIKQGGSFNSTTHCWGDNNFPVDKSRSYQKWIRDLTSKGKNIPETIGEKEYCKHLGYFSEHNIAYGNANYQCDTGNFTPEVLNTLFSLMGAYCK